MIPKAKKTTVTIKDNASGCPIPGRTREISAPCGLGSSQTLIIILDKVDGDVVFSTVDEQGNVIGDVSLSLATAKELRTALHHELVGLEHVDA